MTANSSRSNSSVSYDVEADARMNEQAAEAAKACDSKGSISHDLGHFTEICNLSGGTDVGGSVEGYMNDGGANNREARGHRRWCLNPPMGRVGFGGGTKFAAMACMDTSGKDKAGDTWSYPGKGLLGPHPRGRRARAVSGGTLLSAPLAAGRRGIRRENTPP